MGDTEISWTHRPGTRGRSWNPIQGCRRVSPGCQHCYAERMAARFAEDGWSQGLINLSTRTWNGTARVATHKLAEPLHWKEPSTVFVNSMSDLFYEGFSNEQIASVFGIMALAPLHTFLVLTKRAKRMREWFLWLDDRIEAKAEEHAGRDCATSIHDARNIERRGFLEDAARKALGDKVVEKACHAIRKLERDTIVTDDLPDLWNAWPIPNCWLGVSVEDQERANERIPELLQTPAAVRFLSCEPLLGPIDLRRVRTSPMPIDALTGGWGVDSNDDAHHRQEPQIDWVIYGCESGPGARPCELAWLRSIRDQCTEASVMQFLKQAVDVGSAATNGVDSQGRTTGITCGTGSKPKGHGYGGPVIERPYLDGQQIIGWPEERP